jgi:hypothetical protein
VAPVTSIVESARGWRLDKLKQSHKIDVVVALSLAALAKMAFRPLAGSCPARTSVVCTINTFEFEFPVGTGAPCATLPR